MTEVYAAISASSIRQIYAELRLVADLGEVMRDVLSRAVVRSRESSPASAASLTEKEVAVLLEMADYFAKSVPSSMEECKTARKIIVSVAC